MLIIGSVLLVVGWCTVLLVVTMKVSDSSWMCLVLTRVGVPSLSLVVVVTLLDLTSIRYINSSSR